MNFRSSLPPAIAFCLCWTASATASSEQAQELGAVVQEALTEMEAGQWETALRLLDHALDRFGSSDPLSTFGAQFGAIYYHKGTCEMKLQRWQDAARSLDACYRDFPGEGNVFQKRALLKRAETSMGLGQWEAAIGQFSKFLEERDKTRDFYPQGSFYLNLAICHYKLGQLSEGNDHLETAIKNKTGFPTPDSGIVAAFQELVAAAIAAGNEQVILDFLRQNRSEILLPPYDMNAFSEALLKLAGDAWSSNMLHAALELFRLIPSTGQVIGDLQTRLNRPGGDSRTLRESLETLEAGRRSGRVPEAAKLTAMALIHQSLGDLDQAYAIYQELDRSYPEAPNREETLYQLALASSLLHQTSSTRSYAEQALNQFPGSPRRTEIRQLLLLAVFRSGDHREVIRLAAAWLDELPPGQPLHDLCLHLLGAAHYSLGQSDAAESWLSRHLAVYPESPHLPASAYYLASNAARSHQWHTAVQRLSRFLEQFPHPSPHTSHALLELAHSHHALGQSRQALAAIRRLAHEFTDSELLASAYTLEGAVQLALDDPQAARTSFERALQLAEAGGNRPIAGEALHQLIALSGDTDPSAAVAYADRFWQQYAETSPYADDVAMAQLSAFHAAGRGEEAMSRLRKRIAEEAGALPQNASTQSLEPLVRAYTAAYLQHRTVEELETHYGSFPGIAPDNRHARICLRLAVIERLSSLAGQFPDDPDRRQAAHAAANSLIRKLRTEFARNDLTDQALLQLGEGLRTHAPSPAEAVPYYEEILRRDQSPLRNQARLGRAEIRARSPEPAERDQALTDLKTLLETSADAGLQGRARTLIQHIRSQADRSFRQ